MNVERAITDNVKLARTCTSKMMGVARRCNGKRPCFQNSGLLSFHLYPGSADDHHYLFGDAMKMHRHVAASGAFYKKCGWSRARVSVLNRSREAGGHIRKGCKLHIPGIFDFRLRAGALGGANQCARAEQKGDAESLHVDLRGWIVRRNATPMLCQRSIQSHGPTDCAFLLSLS